jgi:hypothetical protein
LPEGGDFVFLAHDVGDMVAGVLEHPLLTVHRAAPPAHVSGGLLDLLFPCHAEQPVHPLLCEHAGNRLYERRFVGDLTFPSTSGGRQSRQFGLRMTQTCFQPRGLLGGMHGGAHHQHTFVPYYVANRRATGPLTLIALGRQHLVPTVIGAHYPC